MKKQAPIFEVEKLRVEGESVILHDVNWRVGDPRRKRLVLVTHHVEEIAPLLTHMLLLRDGKTFAAGIREEMLTSAHLTATFGAPVFVRRSGSGYRLEVGRHAGTFIHKLGRTSELLLSGRLDNIARLNLRA
jgi:ABC-type cobalamin/Fe3+-siderophores transport system ATPase subunit